MAEETTFGETGREWLTYSHKGKEGKFAFPPVRGTHQKCYQAINADSEIIPAEGLEIALLTQEAYTQNTPRWEKVREDCFVKRYIRAPMRLSWMPHNSELAGAIVERDLEGRGLLSKMNLPVDISNWKKNESGLYVSPNENQIYVEKARYSLGEINENDGLAIAYLGREGAEIFVRTARDNKKVPYSWGLNIKDIKQPEQRVVVLGENGGRLCVDGLNWGGYDYGCAFGVVGGEASAQKINKII